MDSSAELKGAGRSYRLIRTCVAILVAIVCAVVCAVFACGLLAGSAQASDALSTSSTMAWDGSVDVSWYNPTDTTFHISTPAQLAGVAAICDGIMLNGVTTSSANFIGDASYVNPHGRSETEYWGGIDSFKGKTIILDCDIDMGGVYDSATSTWSGPLYEPIGGQFTFSEATCGTVGIIGVLSASFSGTFDGNGHYVRNIHCSLPNLTLPGGEDVTWSQAIGLIGRLGAHDNDDSSLWASTPTVKDVGVTGSIVGGRSVAGIVGKTGQSTDGCLIERCVNYASISNTDAKGCGGIVGAGWNNCTVRDC